MIDAGAAAREFHQPKPRRIKSSRVNVPGMNDERREDRNRVSRPKSRRPNFGAAGAPKTHRAKRRASSGGGR